jgi:hypothetical protein
MKKEKKVERRIINSGKETIVQTEGRLVKE